MAWETGKGSYLMEVVSCRQKVEMAAAEGLGAVWRMAWGAGISMS